MYINYKYWGQHIERLLDSTHQLKNAKPIPFRSLLNLFPPDPIATRVPGAGNATDLVRTMNKLHSLSRPSCNLERNASFNREPMNSIAFERHFVLLP